MTIVTDTYMPYEYENKRDTLAYIESRCVNIKRSLKFIDMDNEHLIVRCPFTGDYLEIVGTPQDLAWLHNELTKRKWYK